MTVPVLPDAVTDPAGFLLAVADLREQRAKACIAKEDPDEYQWYRADDIAGVMQTLWYDPEEREFIAAETPRHALTEVALWREVAAEHQRRVEHVTNALGDEVVFWRDASPILAAAVAAAQAYHDPVHTGRAGSGCPSPACPLGRRSAGRACRGVRRSFAWP